MDSLRDRIEEAKKIGLDDPKKFETYQLLGGAVLAIAIFIAALIAMEWIL